MIGKIKEAKKQERERICNEIERYFELLKTQEPPILVTDFTDTKMWWQGLKDGLTSKEIAKNLHLLGYD